jgi:hypothetical protein
MEAHLHGGFCCGIKHISGLSLPAYSTSEKAELTGEATSFNRNPNGNNAVGDMHRELYGEDFFAPAAPKEKYPERLKRMVEFIKANRKHGLIEIVIQKTYQVSWIPHLEALGFKMVTEFTNGNTSAVLQVYHLAH